MKRKTQTLFRPINLSILLVALPACGQAGEENDSSGLTDSQRAARDEKVAQVRQEIGETSCATTAADVTVDAANDWAGAPIFSPNGAYDHPTCRNAFIVDINNVQASSAIYAGVGLSSSNFFECIFEVNLDSVYQKQGGTFVKLNDGGAFGTFEIAGSSGPYCLSRIETTLPQAGDYRVVVSSFQFLGAQLPVTVYVGAP